MLFENMDAIVFAGDSVTDMGSQNPVGEGLADKLGFGYVRMVENLLVAWYPELDLRVVNSGVSGNTSRDLLARFERDVVSQNPDWLCICIGINDVWRQFDVPAITSRAVSPEEYRANVEQMILALKDSVRGIFLMTPYYMEANEQDFMRRRMDEYGAICKELAAQYGCKLIDLQQVFSEFCTHHHSSRLSWDRVHPNQMGATMIAKAFLKAAGADFSR